MKKPMARTPPVGAPEGTVWFGGPVDRWRVTLRVHGEELDPYRVSALLACAPTSAARKGDPFPKKGRWLLKIDSRDCDENEDVEDGIRMLLGRLPSDLAVWIELTNTYAVSVFCGLFLESANQGFGISAEVSKLLSDRNLEIGFDLHFEPSDPTNSG